ncbi:MAG: Rhodanese-related sulfurtransferase [Verrucomicrobia bacterium]|nr:MAG: Rhodanese-related sulfurtransferase [Verrucomicrobiota bacterium]
MLLCIAFVPAAATLHFDLKWKPPAEFRDLKSLEARDRQYEFVWIDVRQKERFDSNHIPGAISFDENEAALALESVRLVWTPGKKIVVYGEGTGSDRALRVARLIQKEFKTKDVYLLEGGWAAWPRN